MGMLIQRHGLSSILVYSAVIKQDMGHTPLPMRWDSRHQ